MIDYRRILLATDLAEHSDRIAKRARDIANKSKAELNVVYVMEHFPAAYGGGEYAIPIDENLENSLEEKAKESLAKLGKKFAIPKENQYLASGSVKLAVADAIEEINADLLVIGAHSHHGLSLLLGSRANAILNHAKCDALVIKLKE